MSHAARPFSVLQDTCDPVVIGDLRLLTTYGIAAFLLVVPLGHAVAVAWPLWWLPPALLLGALTTRHLLRKLAAAHRRPLTPDAAWLRVVGDDREPPGLSLPPVAVARRRRFAVLLNYSQREALLRACVVAGVMLLPSLHVPFEIGYTVACTAIGFAWLQWICYHSRMYLDPEQGIIAEERLSWGCVSDRRVVELPSAQVEVDVSLGTIIIADRQSLIYVELRSMLAPHAFVSHVIAARAGCAGCGVLNEPTHPADNA